MAKKCAGRKRPPRKTAPKDYSPRDDARSFLPVVVQKLKDGVEEPGELSIAKLKAAELLVKLADIESIPQAVDDAIEIRDAQIDDRKVVPITEAV